jgi:hypothetical protein
VTKLLESIRELPIESGNPANENDREDETHNKIRERGVKFRDNHRLDDGWFAIPTGQEPYTECYINIAMKQLDTYSEGEFSYTACGTNEVFRAEIMSTVEFYMKCVRGSEMDDISESVIDFMPELRAVIDAWPARPFKTKLNERYDASLDAAEFLAEKHANGYLYAYPNEEFAYAGPIVAESEFHYVQKLQPGKTAVIYDKRYVPDLSSHLANKSRLVITMNGAGTASFTAPEPSISPLTRKTWIDSGVKGPWAVCDNHPGGWSIINTENGDEQFIGKASLSGKNNFEAAINEANERNTSAMSPQRSEQSKAKPKM